jgi:DNA-binding CsgD family transcriptional regulator/cell division protein FtsL
MKSFAPRILLFFVCLFASQIAYSQNIKVAKIHKLLRTGKNKQAYHESIAIPEAEYLKFSKRDLIYHYYNLGQTHVHEKEHAKALHYLLQAKKVNVNDSAKYECYFMTFGELFDDIGAYSLAIEFKKKGILRLNASNKLDVYFAQNSIGAMFLKVNQIDSALCHFKIQSETSKLLNDHIAVSSSFNNLGIAQQYKKEYDKSIITFREAEKLISNNTFIRSANFEGEKINLLYNIYGNIGESYFHLKKYQKATDNLKKYASFQSRGQKLTKRYFLEGMLVSAYLKLDKIESAKQVSTSLYRLLNIVGPQAKLDILLIQLEIAQYERNFTHASLISNQLKNEQSLLETERSIANDNMNLLVSNFLLTEGASSLAREKMASQDLVKSMKLERQEKVLVILFAVFAVIIFIVALYFISQNSKNRKLRSDIENETLVLKEEQLEFKVRSQENFLTEFAIESDLKKGFTNETLKNLDALLHLNEVDLLPEIKNLINELKNKQTNDKNVNDLHEKSDLLLINFRIKLVQTHPDLSKLEVKLCSLIYLNLSNKEISIHRNITPESVKVFKNRLRKKLNLSSEINIVTYLTSL